MSAVGKWQARGYWSVAVVLLPLVNPIVLAVASIAADDDDPPWRFIAVVIAVANLVLLGLIGMRIWKRPADHRWRIGLALVLAVALSIPYGFAELLIVLDAACPDEGCFN